MNGRKGSRALPLALAAAVLTLFAWLVFTASPSSDTKVEARALAQQTYTESVSNLTNTSAGACTNHTLRKCALAFTTGSASTGYTLTSIEAKFLASGANAQGFSATLHEASGSNPGTQKATLSGNAPSAAGNYTYTCSGNGCGLSKDTTYFIQVAGSGNAAGTGAYKWSVTTDGSEVKTPSNNGWSIANKLKVWLVAIGKLYPQAAI